MCDFREAMLPRLLLVIVVSVVWATQTETETEAETETETNNDYFPSWLIESTKEPDDLDTHIISSRKPLITGKVKGGTICLNTDECGRGKCCLRRSKSPRRRCRRLQRAGERCTEEQMMGGYYYGFCPCNRHSVCTYVNGTQKCVKKKEQRPQNPVPLPTVPPNNTNETQQESQESQESQEVQQTPKIPSRKPASNLSGNNFPGIPDFLTHKLRPTAVSVTVPATPSSGPVTPPSEPVTPSSEPVTPSSESVTPLSVPVMPSSVPVTPSSVPVEGEGQVPSVPTVPVPAEQPEIPGGTAIPPLPHGFTLIPFGDEDEEGLPGTNGIPGLPPPPMMAPQGSSVVGEQGLPGEEGVPELPPPPPLENAEKEAVSLHRTSRSAHPPPDALLEGQPQVASPVQSAVDGPPFNFDALDGNQERIL